MRFTVQFARLISLMTIAWGFSAGVCQAQTWSAYQIPLDINLQGRINAIAVHPVYDSLVFVGSESAGLFFSNDRGATFRRIVGTLPNDIRDVVWLRPFFRSSDPNNVLLATTRNDFRLPNGGGLWRSSDSGEHWNQVNLQRILGLPDANNLHGYAISQDYGTNKVAVATNKGLALSTDRGVSWSVVNPFGPGGTPDCYAVAYQASNILVAGGAGVRWSTDNGRTWTAPVTPLVGADENNYHGLSWGTKAGMAYYVDRTGSLFYTIDYGQNWTMMMTQPPRPSEDGPGGIRFVYEVTRGSDLELYVGNAYEVYRLTTRADRRPEAITFTGIWTELGLPHYDPRCMAFNRALQPYMLGTDGGLHTTSDRGSNWQAAVRPGLSALQVYDINGQWVGTGADRKHDLYFGTHDNHLWASPDMGGTWPTEYGNEGGSFQMRPDVPSGTPRITFANVGQSGAFTTSGRYFANPQAGQSGVTLVPNDDPDLKVWASEPRMLSSGRLIQAVYVGAGVRAEPLQTGLAISDASETTWSQLTTFTDQRVGFLYVSQNDRQIRVFQPYETGWDPDLNLPRRLLLSVTTSTSSFARAATIYGRMEGFGSIGRRNFQFLWAPVIDAHPSDLNTVLAADIKTGGVMRSLDAGDNWSIVRSLTDLVLHGGRYRFTAGDGPGIVGDVSFVTAISYCPFDPSRILVGCRTGGAYISEDGGANWSRVINSEPIANVTAFHWLSSTEAYASTWGTGIWRLSMAALIRPRESSAAPEAGEPSRYQFASRTPHMTDGNARVLFIGLANSDGSEVATRQVQGGDVKVVGLAAPPFQGVERLVFHGGTGDPWQPRYDGGAPVRVRLAGLAPKSPKELEVSIDGKRLAEREYSLDAGLNELRVTPPTGRGGHVLRVVWLRGQTRTVTGGTFFVGGAEGDAGAKAGKPGKVTKVTSSGGAKNPPGKGASDEPPRKAGGGEQDIKKDDRKVEAPGSVVLPRVLKAADLIAMATVRGGELRLVSLASSKDPDANGLEWNGMKSGDELTLRFDLPAQLSVSLFASFLRGPQAGSLRVLVNGQEIGGPLELNSQQETTGKLPLGRIELRPGANTITFVAVPLKGGSQMRVSLVGLSLEK